MPTFPVASPRDLGLGYPGGATQAPALVQGVGLVVDQGDLPSEAVWLYPYSAADPATLTGQVPGGLVFGLGSYAGNVYVVNDAGAPVKFLDNGALAGTITVDSLDLGDNDPINFGDGDDIVMKWNGSAFAVTQAAADSSVLWGVSGAGINHVFYGDTAGRDLGWDQSNNQLLAADNTAIAIGSGAGAAGDISLAWDGSKLVVSQLTANSAVDWGVDGAGLDQNWYGDTASAKMMWDQSQDARIMSGAAVDVYAQATTGTGQLVQIIGPDITHGFARYQYEATISPAAVETALFTVPAMSRIVAVQANVETALTGGGTTVTFSIGITGDVDAYGTASNSGVQADLLTQNAKVNAMGTIAANAGASIGVFSAATVALKLIAAATGGASAGDTALTVGSVKIRVLYETLLPMADA